MKIALLFSGYGSQYVGMGKELYDEYRIVQEYFEEASNCANTNFVKLCFASSDAEIGKLANAYMSLFLVGSAVFALLKELGITPDIVAGYNNGEVTSLFAGGCFSLPDGLYLLNKMCSFYQEELDKMDINVMRVVGKTAKELENMFRKISKDNNDIHIAFYEGEKEHIIVGLQDVVGQLHTALEIQDGVTIDYLSPEIGLHSDFMNSSIDQFKIYLEKVDFKDLSIPMISGIDGNVVVQGEEIKERFIRHFTLPFKFNLVLASMHAYDIIIIATPSAMLGKMVKDYYPEKNVITIEKKVDIESLQEMMNINNVTE